MFRLQGFPCFSYNFFSVLVTFFPCFINIFSFFNLQGFPAVLPKIQIYRDFPVLVTTFLCFNYGAFPALITPFPCFGYVISLLYQHFFPVQFTGFSCFLKIQIYRDFPVLVTTFLCFNYRVFPAFITPFHCFGYIISLFS